MPSLRSSCASQARIPTRGSSAPTAGVALAWGTVAAPAGEAIGLVAFCAVAPPDCDASEPAAGDAARAGNGPGLVAFGDAGGAVGAVDGPRSASPFGGRG